MKKLIVFSLMVMLTVAMPVFGAGMTITDNADAPMTNVALQFLPGAESPGVLSTVNDGVGTEQAYGQSFTTVDAFDLGAVSFQTRDRDFPSVPVCEVVILDAGKNVIAGPLSASWPGVGTTLGNWITMTFNAPVSLAADTTYYYIYTFIGPFAGRLDCHGTTASLYSGGMMMRPTYTAGNFPTFDATGAASLRDMYFVLQEYVDTGVNSEPFVDAGSDAAIYLQSYRDGGNIVIDASAADDGNIQPLTYTWSVIGDDTNVSFVDITVEDPNVTFSALGSYELQLEVYDGEFYASDTVVITVIDNVDPTADAGADQIVSLADGGTAVLAGTAGDDGEPNDVGGYVLTTTWSVTAQPAGSEVIFDDASSLTATAAFDTAGEYILTLTADDNGGNPATDEMLVSVSMFALSEISILPADDTLFRAITIRGDWNYGAATEIWMQRSLEQNADEGLNAAMALLKFDIYNEIPGAISSAKLNMFSKDPNPETRVRAVNYGPSGEWFEGDGNGDPAVNPDTTGVGITWNTYDMVVGSVLDEIADIADESWYEFDVTGLVVESDGKATLGLDAPAQPLEFKGWQSKEGANQPLLVVMYAPDSAHALLPVDGAVEVHPDNTVFAWKSGASSVKDEVFVGTDPASLVSQGTVNVLVDPNEMNVSGLAVDTEFFWQVVSYDGADVVIGESAVQSFTVMEFHPDIPCLVSPADLSVDVVPAVVLQWLEGESAEGYDLYIGTDEALVIANDPSVKVSGVATPYTVENLVLKTTYYWTVVATAAADGPWPAGEVFSFTTANYALIDSFEDGYWAASGGADANSVDTYANDGDFSMEIKYDDAGDVASVVTKTFAVAQDLTFATGRESLQVNFKGLETNDAEEMYVALSDGTSEVKIIYDEPADIIEYSWENFTEWNIDLADFAPVDLSAVTGIAIGLGDGIADGRNGTVYIDDIRVYVTRCISDFVDGDIINGDCTAGPEDIALMAKDWLTQGETVTAGTASTDGLLVQFDFEEAAGATVATSSVTYDGVNAATATVVDNPILGAAGKTGLAVDMASAGYLTIDTPAAVFASVDSAMTISLWCYGNPQIDDGGNIVLSSWFRVNTVANNLAIYSRGPNISGNPAFGTNNMGGDFISTEAAPELWRNQWNHYAFVVDAAANFQGIYCNGVLIANNSDDASAFAFDLAGLESFEIGGIPAYHGLIDDFRVYDRALGQAEVLDLAGEVSVDQPLVSNADANEDGFVNLGDFAEMASVWLDQVFWP